MIDLAVTDLAVSTLQPHPQNPRLTTRQDVVEQIAGQLKTQGFFDPAHALLVRPREDGESYEIIAGFHRWLAAQKADLETVPCWVREMSDNEAYMALSLTNTQSELHALEEGFHALRSGMKIRAYAAQSGKEENRLTRCVHAARVVCHVADNWLGAFDGPPEAQREALDTLYATDDTSCWRHLAEIHPAPQWLWIALVTKLFAEAWTVEKTREYVKRVQKVEAPPAWVDTETVATNVVNSDLRLDAVPRFAKILEQSLGRIARVDEDSERFAEILHTRLATHRPAQLSDVETICNAAESEQRAIIETRQQADLFRTRRDEEIAARIATRRRHISLEEWHTLKPDEQEALLQLNPRDVEAVHFNKQENTDIEWAQFSWNPVTGCLHHCPYCYARDIAYQDRMAKAYPFLFAPTFRPSTVFAPRHMMVPPEAATDTRYRNVFTCSMADLFGRWVPDAWIKAVLNEIRNASQWNFLCLTKFPKRAIEFALPPNAWMGTTVDLQARVKAAEDAFEHITAGVRWLSIEPLLEPLRFQHLERFEWMVIGGASATYQTGESPETPEWRPPFAWIEALVRQARDAGCKVYFKTNLLRKRLLEMPFDAPILGEDAPAPAVFAYLKSEAPPS